MDADEQEFIDRLNDPGVRENDKSSCLDVLEVLLGPDVIPALRLFIADDAQPRSLREQARKVVRTIEG